ncbi:hypothetical protein H8K90_15120 [Winogradskyella echinorum]|uniref:Uncharacterized protein n=1 Tax=Winogradskyella echinorum TaxID=538189 RepID=A0ABR6Y4S8_9FLAO|nr:hypothetical protein [Winogradskyella echinorum]MBC3847727.1 hypothetical protein [Winogradskyella echinorum]MBC5752075.1 hypothetical protein [Winogradskyella echinorum]
MKNFEVTFKNGLLLDKQTGKRINLKPFETYYLQGDDNSFLLEEYIKTDYKPLDASQKLKTLENRHNGYELKQLASAGDKFVFRVGLGKRFEEDVVREYLFDAALQEDLYMKKKHNKASWTLCNCVCNSPNLLEGELGFPFQNVEANSLSELFANVVSTYFNMKRSTACNAFKTFYYYPKEDRPTLYWLKSSKKLNLDLKRKAIVINRKQKEILKRN